jgi:hypothetical protein
VGKPSKRSLQLFFMACYDIDRFRIFINSEGFMQSFALDDEEYAKLNSDDVALMHFGFRFLKQVLFGEESIALREGALEARVNRSDKSLAELQEAQNDRETSPDIEPLDL